MTPHASHAGFQGSLQMLARFRKSPGPQRSLIERARLLFDERLFLQQNLRETIFR
jgi:hypothetical protein